MDATLLMKIVAARGDLQLHMDSYLWRRALFPPFIQFGLHHVLKIQYSKFEEGCND
jgi:hypothetical protein